MNIKRVIAIVLIVTSLFCVSASAAVVDSATADNNSQYATITGKLSVSAPTEMTVTVLNPGYTEASLASLTEANFSEIVNNFVQLTTADDGRYTVSYKLCGSSGDYPVIINYAGGADNASQEAIIEFYALVDILAALDSVNSAASSGEIQSIVESKYKLLSVSLTDYNRLSVSNKAAAAQAFFADKEALSGGFAATSDAAMSFEAHSAFYRSGELTVASELRELLERNDIALGLTALNAYPYWNSLDSESKLTVCAEILDGAPLASINALRTLFSQRVVLEAVNSLSNWKGLREIIANNGDTLSAIDLSAYLAITDTSSIDKIIVETTYSQISDFCKAVNDEVTAYTAPVIKPTTPPDYTPTTPGSPSYVTGGSNGGTSVGGTPVTGGEATSAFPFTDMENTAWAKDAVAYLHNAGVINGKSATAFAPNDLITREEFAKLLVEAFSQLDAGAVSDFTDVDSSKWYAPYVATAFSKGIVQGMGDGKFGIGMPVTRQDMCVMAYRAAQSLGIFHTAGDISAFADNASIAGYAHESVGALYGSGYIKGVGANMFMPLDNATRAQAAQLLYQLIKQ